MNQLYYDLKYKCFYSIKDRLCFELNNKYKRQINADELRGRIDIIFITQSKLLMRLYDSILSKI
jgi:hypothetical protein